MSNFRDKLKEIWTAERLERVPLTDEELGLNDGTDEFLARRDELVRRIEQLMRDFIAESPSFSISHGFFEGKYSVSLSSDELCRDHRGEVDKCFSRLNLLLAPYHGDALFEMTSKLTVLNRDLPKATISGGLEGDMEKFQEFAEQQVLRFAREYFASRRPAHVPVPQA